MPGGICSPMQMSGQSVLSELNAKGFFTPRLVQNDKKDNRLQDVIILPELQKVLYVHLL